MTILEVVLTQRFFNQTCINRWNYLSSGTPTGVTHSFALLTAMGFFATAGALPADTIGGDLQETQPETVIFENALAKVIREAPTDFYDSAFPAGVVGKYTGQTSMSPTQAYGFTTNRIRQDIARGTKRFVGVVEAANASGGVIESSVFAGLNALAGHMTDILTYTAGGNSLSYSPIVVQKEEYETPSGKRAYKYYPTITAQLEHIAQGIVWTPYTTVRTQTSRQYSNGS